MTLKNEIAVPVSAWTVSGGRIPLGYVGESNVERVIFDFSEDLPAAVYRIEIKDRSRSGWHLLRIEGRTAVFDVPADILLFSGAVDLQIVAVAEGATVKKSNVFSGYVYGSVQAGEEVPPEEISAFEQALAEYNEKLTQAIDAAESAAQSAADAVQSASEARSAEIGATMAANAADLSHRDVEAVKESVKTLEGAAESARDDAARNAITASGFADAAERAKVDAQESARKAQASATESARHASESASSAELAGRSVEAIRSMSADAETLEAGSEATASYDIGANRLHFGIPKGEKGDKGDAGERGADGVNGINGRDGRDGVNGRDGIDGRDGVDGRTPVKGVDYFTASDVDEVVQETIERVPPYDDTEIKTDIENLESKKVGYSEVSGNQLLMYADSTKSVLLATLDLPAAPVQDVQVAGESKVVDGVADIPIASNSKAGVARFNSSYGLVVNSINCVEGAVRTEESLKQYGDTHIISKGTLNNIKGSIVKSVLSAPVSDTDPEWSNVEKLAARERMDAEARGFTPIVDYTAEVEETRHTFAETVPGDFSEVVIILNLKATEAVTAAGNVTFYVNTLSEPFATVAAKGEGERFSIARSICVDGVRWLSNSYYLLGAEPNYYSSFSQHVYLCKSSRLREGDKIISRQLNALAWGIGSTIKIYAR